MRRNILIIGATGKQGRSLIRALVDLPHKSSDNPSNSFISSSFASEIEQHGTNGYHIYALTRDPTSPAGRDLLSINAELHSPDSDGESPVQLVKGDFDDEKLMEMVFLNVKPWGVFVCLPSLGLGADATRE